MPLTVKDIKIGLSWLVILALIVLVSNLVNLREQGVKADVEQPTTQVQVTNATPSVSSVVLHYNANITLAEWAQGAGTTIATTTFTVTDGNGYEDISTTSIIAYRSGASNEQNCAADNENCYRGDNWTQQVAGNTCNRYATTTDTASFWCTSTLQFFADPTDAGTYIAQWWEVYASTSDLSYAAAYATNSAVTLDVITTRALAIDPNSISYGSLGAGVNTVAVWSTTTATTTGNVAVDIEFKGDAMVSGPNSIVSTQQEFTTTTGITWGSGTDLPGAYVGHDMTMAKPNANPPQAGASDKILWGIGIPTLQAAGTYNGTNYLQAIDPIVNP